jgi:hypothetical protein
MIDTACVRVTPPLLDPELEPLLLPLLDPELEPLLLPLLDPELEPPLLPPLLDPELEPLLLPLPPPLLPLPLDFPSPPPVAGEEAPLHAAATRHSARSGPVKRWSISVNPRRQPTPDAGTRTNDASMRPARTTDIDTSPSTLVSPC